MDEFICSILRLHPDIIALTEMKLRNPGSPIQLSELKISGHDVFTSIEQIGTRGVCLNASQLACITF